MQMIAGILHFIKKEKKKNKIIVPKHFLKKISSVIEKVDIKFTQQINNKKICQSDRVLMKHLHCLKPNVGRMSYRHHSKEPV